ncbi:hypothetical protein BDV97DRAFT_391798 [Delphinella strobiligena]|nr:hypothetical protein BDV97DRAFT_391798 [Delphinella strobiligena]
MTQTFFDAFLTFNHNARAPIQHEFHRLAGHMHWNKNQYKPYRAQCYVQELAAYWDNLDYSTLGCWQELCEELGVSVVPGSISGCKKRDLHTRSVGSNTSLHTCGCILDLIDARRAGTRVRTFGSAGEMMRYTRESGKIMPISVVKEDRFLSALLKKL